MVLIALPALQRNQRDAQRKNDMSLFVDALQRYAANNKGRYPSVGGSGGGPVNSSNAPEVYNFALRYLNWPGQGAPAGDKSFIDPSSGLGYVIMYMNHHPANIENSGTNFNGIGYSPKARCIEPGNIYPVYDTNAIAVWIKLESGGTNCVQVR